VSDRNTLHCLNSFSYPNLSLRDIQATCHGHDYQHAANEEIAGICCRIGAILELKKEEEITRVCASNNTLGIIKVRARGQPREQKYVAALESTRKLAVTLPWSR